MEHNPVVWFEIYVEDMKRAETFYEGLLDVALEEAKMEGVEMWIFPHDIAKSGATGALVRHEMRPPNIHGTLVIFQYRIAASGKPRRLLKACQFMCQKWILASMALSPLLVIVKAIVSACIRWFNASSKGYWPRYYCINAIFAVILVKLFRPSGVAAALKGAELARLFLPCQFDELWQVKLACQAHPAPALWPQAFLSHRADVLLLQIPD